MNKSIEKVSLRQEDYSRLVRLDACVFEKFYRGYKEKVYNYLLIKTKGDTHVADDVLSETFLSALLSVTKLKNDINLGAWILQIAHRRLVDYYKKNSRKKKIIEMLKKNMIVHVNDIQEEELLEKERKIFFYKAIKKIKSKYVQIIKLKYFEKRTQKEIAQLLNKNEKAIEGLLFRARTALKIEIQRLQAN